MMETIPTMRGPAGRAFPVDLEAVRGEDPPVTAEVRSEGGIPRLYVDGARRDPLFFFGNTEWRGHEAHVSEEIRMAATRGFHLHTIVLHFPVVPEGTPCDLSGVDSVMDRVLAADPEALLIPRIPLYPADAGWWRRNRPDDLMRFAPDASSASNTGSLMMNLPDGATIPSVASDEWMRQACAALEAGISYILSRPEYAQHVIGYHITYNATGEWFYESYREKGADFSPCNLAGFRRWLSARHGSVAALSAAWGRRVETFEAVGFPNVPHNLPGSDDPQVFLSDSQADIVDFYRYLNDVNELRIEQLSALVKKRTNRRSLVMIFYGYNLELPDPKSGHCNLSELLACRDVDMLASPISYQDRAEGGLMAYMAPVDSIQAHGVLWMVEDDTRTFRAVDQSEMDASFNPTIRGFEDTLAVQQRNFASTVARGCGLWWMDLWGSGWLEDDRIWDANERMSAGYSSYHAHSAALAPEVAILVDEKSVLHLNNPSRHAHRLLYAPNAVFYRAGFSFGIYTLADAAAGRLPDSCRLLVLLDPLALSAEAVAGLKSASKRGGRTLLWIYGSGSALGENAFATVGLPLEYAPGPANTSIRYDGSPGGYDENVFPRASVREDPNVHVLGRYADDGTAAVAYLEQDGWTSAFSGSMGLTTGLLRTLARQAGAHVFLDTDDQVQAGKDFLTVHARTSGLKHIRFPGRCDVHALFDGNALHEVHCEGDDTVLDLPMERCTTVTFRYTRAGMDRME